MFTGNHVRRGLAIVVLTLAVAALGAAVAFWRAGQDLVVMTLIFGGSGIYLMIEGLGLLIVIPRSKSKSPGNKLAEESPKEHRRPSRAA